MRSKKTANRKNMIVIRNRLLPLRGYDAMNIAGVLFCRQSARLSPSLLRHEMIHTAQMREMAYVGFYLWYVVEWVVSLNGRICEAY